MIFFCFGIYLKTEQIGFERVLSDIVLAYATNLFIIEAFRGKGISKVLLEKMLLHKELAEIELWFLATKDSQVLHKKFGYTMLSKPESIGLKTKIVAKQNGKKTLLL